MVRNKKHMLECTTTLSTTQAIALRELGVDLEYRCPNPECDAPVIVLPESKDRKGVTYRAHFEHRTRNPKCPYGEGIEPATAVVQAE
jgi:hypothetical protein